MTDDVEKKVDLASMNLEALTAFVVSLGEKGFRAKQLYRWLHQRGAQSFDEMTDLSKELRGKLQARAEIVGVVKDLEQRSIDGTIKYRFKTHDGRLIDSYMRLVKNTTAEGRTLVAVMVDQTFHMLLLFAVALVAAS